MINRPRRINRHSALLLTTALTEIAMFGLAGAANAADQAFQFDIPAEPLGQALTDFSRISSQQVVFSETVTNGRNTSGLHGSYTAAQALDTLLAGTDLRSETNAAGVVMVRSKNVLAAQNEGAANTGVETVVVTAQHKSENIQQVPIAVTALSQQQLTERQIAGGPDLVKEVPNLTFSKTNFSGYNLEIRGIGTQAISVTTDPAVAIAFNGIPFIRNHFFEQEFFDLDNLEVLRGPQGTLYGRNATAGVVNILSAKPADTYEAILSADIGDYDSRRYEGMINLPIASDTLDLRIAGEWTKRDGYSTNDITNTPIDGRDLWSGRMTLGWKPRSDIQTYLVWEHFSEDDDRLRSGKQLCTPVPIPTGFGSGLLGDNGDFLSQGCGDGSLYSPAAFGEPNGLTLPLWKGLAGIFHSANNVGGDYNPYTGTQSDNLRTISSELNPTYKAKNDTLEFNADWNVTPALILTSQTGYNHDFLWSTEDYNRFATIPDAINLANEGAGVNIGNNTFCDPQLGCSNRFESEDLSDEHAWQIGQEFRLASSYSGPLNFSVGANYLHYETDENYYVFSNALTLLAIGTNLTGGHPPPGGFPPWVPGVSTDSFCLTQPHQYAIGGSVALQCSYIDPNPLGSLDNLGHNYFLNQNPYILNSYAMFGEAYYDIAKDLKLTAGARWTDDQKHFIDIPSEILTAGYGYPVFGVTDQQWDRWTGRGVLDWTPQLDFTDQTLVYGSIAHGYKAGGANPPGAELLEYFGTSGHGGEGEILNPIHPPTFKPEYIESFELGTKNTLLDGSLTLNGDIFYYNYTGYQISEIVDRSAINLNFNTNVKGAELETNWEPLPGFKLGLAQGFENATLAGGSQAVDLMDRTAGNPGWMVVRPFVTQASNCILPVDVVAQLNRYTGFEQACGAIYGPGGSGIPGAPNNGEGFDKNLSGNQLPNAPHFTSSLTAEYTMPVSNDWAATLHGDFYWQSQQWARVFEDPIDKLHGYSNVNLSLILTSANGWQVMGYVKNVFNVTAITGTFLNTDDTDLTTNVFLTDPRLFGVRVTKHLDESDGFWGSEYSGSNFFTDLFSDTDGGKPPLWIELGGQFDLLDDSRQELAPPFFAAISKEGYASPLKLEQPPFDGLDEEAKVSFTPDGSDWVFSAAVRYGRASGKGYRHQQTTTNLGANPTQPWLARHRYAETTTGDTETHDIFDFMAGKDVGLGALGMDGTSILSGGVRFVQFRSKSSLAVYSDPDYVNPNGSGKPPAPKYFHNFGANARNKASFTGIGPAISWDASTPLGGDASNEQITFDWGSNGAVLFGRQRSRGYHQTNGKLTTGIANFPPEFYYHTTHYTHSRTHNRSRMVTVPNLGGFAGISFKYQNAKVSFGYRADEFFGAMDGGIDSYKAENRGFFGPFANISIGLGG
jgi:iron complex outermembrane receptor protein